MGIDKQLKRNSRKKRVRKKIFGTADRPRISVYKSNQYVYVQAIDDVRGNTLATAQSNKQSVAGKSSKSIAAAQLVGSDFGKSLQEKKITQAVFDTNGYRYHGAVRAISEGIRESGIKV